jgi:hypothetical protein
MKKLTKKVVAEITDVCDNKYYKTTWLRKRVENKEVLVEDIYKFKDFFNTFEKNKRKFEYPNIHHYNTKELVRTWINECIEIQEKGLDYTDIIGNDSYCTPSEIEKITKHNGNEYFGLWNGYQVFKIENVTKESFRDYGEVLGRIKGRNVGAYNRICTFPNYDRYLSYLVNYGKDNRNTTPYFVLFNLNDDKSPYQLHFESTQFMDRNDDNILGGRDYHPSKMFPISRNENTFINLVNFIGENDERYSMSYYFDNYGFNKIPYGNDLILPLDDNSIFDKDLYHKYKAKTDVCKVKLLVGDRWTKAHIVIATLDVNGFVTKYELKNNKTNNTIVTEFNIANQKTLIEKHSYYNRFATINDYINKQYEYDTNGALITEVTKVKDKFQVCGYDESLFKHFEGASSFTNIITICEDITEKVYRYPNGKKKKVERYQNGKLNGWCDYYDEKGKISKQERYNLGTLCWQSDYEHKPLKKKVDVNVDTFSKFRNELSNNILELTNRNSKISKTELSKRMSEVEKLQLQISEYADKIRDLQDQIDKINSVEMRSEAEVTEIKSGLKEVVMKNNIEISNFLAPMIDEMMSKYPKFQRYKIDEECNNNVYSSCYYLPFYYTHKLGYMMKFTLVKSWHDIFTTDSDSEIVDSVNSHNFRFDIELINKNHNDIAKRNFSWGENSKHYGEIILNNCQYSAKGVLNEIQEKIKFYADFIHDRIR